MSDTLAQMPSTNCPRCGHPMATGWVYSKGLRWSEARMGLIHTGTSLFERNRPALHCPDCLILIVHYGSHG